MKKLLIAAIVAAAAAGGIVGYYQTQRASHQELSALMLANIEALSSSEGLSIACFKTISKGTGMSMYCATCSWRYGYVGSNYSTCGSW